MFALDIPKWDDYAVTDGVLTTMRFIRFEGKLLAVVEDDAKAEQLIAAHVDQRMQVYNDLCSNPNVCF
jgi:hypothetical protein